MTLAANRPYIGRFAPSPTGPLHLGSLLAAVASFLDARAHQGQWLLRMEDLDPPREVAGSQQTIIRSLQAHGLIWDSEILYQSQRHDAYLAALKKLQSKGLVFICDCSRQQLGNGPYSGRCRQRQLSASMPVATRIRVEPGIIRLQDTFQGDYCEDVAQTTGDFVLLRKDGLWAYQLAVVVDDMAQEITHVLRGCDLLDSTPRQIYLQQKLAYPTPIYGHFAVIIGSDRQKLSKQNHAPPIDDQQATTNLRQVLALLRQTPPPLALRSAPAILAWATLHWDRTALATYKTVELPR